MAHNAGSRLAFYSSIGAALTHYEVDVDAATLTRRAAVRLPEMVQYIWPHAARRYLHVASSTRGPGSSPAPGANTHHLSALAIDPASGALSAGRPTFVRKYDVETGGETQFWTGMIELP